MGKIRSININFKLIVNGLWILKAIVHSCQSIDDSSP